MRKTLAALSLLAGLLPAALAGPAVASPTQLAVRIDDSSPGTIEGTTDPGLQVDVAVRSPRGALKATARTVADGSGAFRAGVARGALGGMPLAPGDTLEVTLEGVPSQTYSMVYSHIVFTRFEVERGIIAGKVTPRKPRIACVIEGERIIPDPGTVAAVTDVSWTTASSGRKTGPGGDFTLRPALSGAGWTGTFRRGDYLRASYTVHPVAGSTDFSFTVSFSARVPVLATAEVGSNAAMLWALTESTYSCRLRSRTGTVKARTAVSTTRYYGRVAFMVFRARDGGPVAMRTGDTLEVSGVGGFSAKVPRLGAIIDSSTNSVTVLGPPRSFVLVNFRLLDDSGDILPEPTPVWVRTDAAGLATASPDGVNPLRLGDQVILTHIDSQGHRWMRLVQDLPPSPGSTTGSSRSTPGG